MKELYDLFDFFQLLVSGSLHVCLYVVKYLYTLIMYCCLYSQDFSVQPKGDDQKDNFPHLIYFKFFSFMKVDEYISCVQCIQENCSAMEHMETQ